MPGFGKSGTWRIFDLRWSIRGRLVSRVLEIIDRESVRRQRLDVFHVHVFDAGSRRALPQGALEARHRLGLAFRHGLDAPVIEIADGPCKTLAPRGVGREEPEADALHTTAHQEAPGHTHQVIVARLSDLPSACGFARCVRRRRRLHIGVHRLDLLALERRVQPRQV